MFGNPTWFASLSFGVGDNVDVFSFPVGETCATSALENGSGGSSSKACHKAGDKAGEASSLAERNGPVFIAQIAACVRLWTRIFRRIALT